MNPEKKLIRYLKGINREDGEVLQFGSYKPFTVTPIYEDETLIGVKTSNLEPSPFLPLDVFIVTIELLRSKMNNTAVKGKAMSGKLGSPELPLDSVEGYVALKVFGKKEGVHVFRKITPISRILQQAGVCENGRGYLRLLPN